MLCGCSYFNTKDEKQESYNNLLDTIKDRTTFASASDYFNISYDITNTDEGYRYYITIDAPRVAMYGVQVIAVERGQVFSNNMAANIGILDGEEYNMIPNQANVSKKYVAGLTVSANTDVENPDILMLVQWYSKSQEVKQEFFEFTIVHED